MIGENTTRWSTALVILPFVATLKRSKKLGYIHTVSNAITDFGEAIVVQII